MSKLLRGVDLVDAVFAQRRARGELHIGATQGAIANRRIGDRPLTAALARWLESDDEMFTLGPAMSFAELVATEYGDDWVEAFDAVAGVLTAPCVLFEGWGSDSRRFLYLGTPDPEGELPVFTLDNDDAPYLCLNGPVDVWLAQHAGFLEDEAEYGQVPAAYEPARRLHAALNFDGNVSCLDGQLSRKLDPYEDEGTASRSDVQ